MNHYSTLLRLLLLAAFLAGCSKPTTLPPPTQAPPPTSTDTPVPSSTTTSTPTSVPTATTTPTNTPTPTLTPFPSLTPLPAGYYANFDAGFSFKHPVAWKLDEETGSFVRLVDQSMGMMTIVVGYPAVDESTGAKPETIDTVVPGFSKAFFGDIPTKSGKTFLVKLSGEAEAPAKDVSAKVQGNEVLVRIIFYTKDYRSYLFIFVGAADSIHASQPTIERLLGSVSFFPPQPYGLPKDHNLVLMGGDPEPNQLDPALTTGSADQYIGLLYTGLVRLTPDLQIAPDLAEGYTISPDGSVYTFTLRAGLKFASGSDLTTQDVIDSWERAADPKTESTTARTYLGDIRGVKEKLDGKADHITGLKAVDDRTLVVTLDSPKPYFLAKLTYPTSFVVNREKITSSQDWVWKPDPSGPYSLKEYKEEEVIVFERNPNYTPAPAIQYVTYIINPGGSWISRYEDGTLDVAFVYGDTAERVRREDDSLHKDLQSVTSLCTTYVAFDNTQPPFDDLQARKAFSLAIDRAAFVERLTNNLDIPALTILPPGLPGFSENLSAAEFDVQAAKTALKESKYGAKFPQVTLEASGFANEGSDRVNALVDMWKKTLGVKIKVSYLDPNNFTQASVQEKSQFTLYGWCADYPDPQNFLDILFRTGSEFNGSGYTNPKVDALLDKAAVEIDPAARLALYQEIEKMLLEDFAVIPIEHGVENLLVRPRLQGYVPSPIVNLYLPWLSLEPAKP